MVVPIKYDWAETFSEGLAAVGLKGKLGYIDKTGNEVIPLKYDLIGEFSANGLAKVYLDEKWSYIDKTGNEVTPVKYDEIRAFSAEGLAKVRLDGKWGYIDKTGNEVTPIKYDEIEAFSVNGLAMVKLDGKWGYIDKTGNEVTPIKYDKISKFPLDGLVRVELNGKYGYIDEIGNEVIPAIYEEIRMFGDLAKVKLAGKYGYIDKTGKEIIPVKYDRIGDFSADGLVMAVLDGKSGYISKTGKKNTAKLDADIVELLENGIIEAEIIGGDITYVNVRIRRLVSDPVTVRIPVGSFFVSENSSVQNMVATGGKNVRLTAGGWQSISIPAACANRPKKIPGSGNRFSVQRSPNQQELAGLMPVLNRSGAGMAVKQAAVWIITDNAGYGDLGILVRSPVGNTGAIMSSRVIGDQDAARAMKICVDAGINIKEKKIWKDRKYIISGLPAGELKNWLENFE
jgi:uncharacterized protein YnzC (UPF0291/DUF896 family)